MALTSQPEQWIKEALLLEPTVTLDHSQMVVLIEERWRLWTWEYSGLL